jgi:hypothetical protein
MLKNDPIEQIKENLLEYEEPYQLGAWENFVRYRKAKVHAKMITWIPAAAASLLFALLASYWLIAPSHQTTDLIATEPLEPLELPETGPEVIIPEFTPLEKSVVETYASTEDTLQQPYHPDEHQAGQTESTAAILSGRYTDLISLRHIPLLDDISSPKTDSDTKPRTWAASSVIRTERSEAYEERTLTSADLSAAQTYRSALSFGLAYSPLLNIHQSATDWNIGAGLSVQWDFMENLSLSSGLYIAQSQLRFSGDEVPLTSTVQTFDSANMEIDFLSLEIPMNLQYSLNDRFFFSGGISSASFLRENYSYHYQYQEMSRTQLFIEGEYREVSQWVTLSGTETASEPSLSSFHPLAFYNFSLGYNVDQAGHGKFTITIEPFFKLPARSFSSRKISYSTGGLQLKIVF